MKRFLLTLLLTTGTTIVSLAQCAMCQASVQSTLSNGRYQSGSGLNMGILYLLLMPYLLMGLVAFFWYRNSRREYARKMALWQRVRGSGLPS